MTNVLAGTWAVTMRTPIGSIEAEMHFALNEGGFSGTATGKGETVPLHDITAVMIDTGERVTWTQTITKPMRLHLTFDVLVDGDRMEGHSRAGRLPRSTVTGRRI